MKKTGRIKTLLHMIRLVASASPGIFILQYFWSILNGISLAVTPIVLEQLFRIILQSELNALPAAALGRCVLGLLLISLFSEMSAGFAGYFGEIYTDIANRELSGRVNRKAGRIAAIEYEKPEFLNDIEKVYPASFQTQTVVYKIMDLLSSYFPYFIIYGMYLYHVNPVLPGMLMLIFLPVLLSQVLKGKLYGRLEDKTAVFRRRKQYFAACMGDKEYVKETRIYGLRDFFRKHYRDAVHAFNQYIMEAGKKSFRISLAASCLNMLGYVCMIVLLLWLVLSGHIALASFAAILGSVRTAYEQMEEMVEQQAGEFSVAWALSKNYRSFMARPEEDRPSGDKAKINELALQGVSFIYPDGTRALNDISIMAKRGDCIAIVGENGSGKTTLAKLLTGVYAPSAGLISSAGPVQVMNLRRSSSHLFQHFNNYKMTVRENIGISDSEPYNLKRMQLALETAGFSLGGKQELTPDSMLGREFGGAELSGGQWQKLAIARAVYRNADVLVLDEPTAAIDPEHESRLYHTFSACAKDKICFIITHRLGLVKICNRIIVMRAGEIIDVGTHNELLARCDYYDTLWEAQAKQYE